MGLGIDFSELEERQKISEESGEIPGVTSALLLLS